MGSQPRFEGVHSAFCQRRSSLISATVGYDWDDNWRSSVSQSAKDMRERVESALSTLLDTEERELSLPEYAEKIDEDATPKPHPYAHLKVGEKWQEIQGANDWRGLLDPMDAVLRGELIRYGEFAHAAYDGFDFDEFSKFRGSCKFRREHFFEKLELENRGYEVTSYLYATSAVELPKFFNKPEVHDEEEWCIHSNWMGYVAVCTAPEEIQRLGRRDIVVAWRGTVTNLEWLENIRTMQCPTGEDPFRPGTSSDSANLFGWASKELKVEQGFLSLYESEHQDSHFTKQSARKQLWAALAKLMEKYKNERLSITVVGHSLGASLATLCAYDMAESVLNYVSPDDDQPATGDQVRIQYKPKVEAKDEAKDEAKPSAAETELRRVPITVYTFGGPRLGNCAFRDRLTELNVKVLRVVNVHDLVTRVSGLLFNETTKFLHFLFPDFKVSWIARFIHELLDHLPGTYSHVGTELQVDNLDSPFLKPSKQPVDAHNLECYLHLLDGYVGKSVGSFSDRVCKRDVALVNKNSNLLHPQLRIPACWFQKENKGLVRDEAGRFHPRGRHILDHPHHQ